MIINCLFVRMFKFLVDLILRELNISSDGRVFYENLVQMLTQPLQGRR